MGYIIVTNDNRYICVVDSKGSLTKNRSEANTFKKELSAENYIKTMPKNIKAVASGFKVLPSEETVPVVKEEIKKKENIPTQNEEKTVLMAEYDAGDELQELMKSLTNFAKCVDSFAERKEHLCAETSKKDREVSNILHMIELSDPKNASDGYLEYAKLRDVLKRRREIKDELWVLTTMLSGKAMDMTSENLDNIYSRLFNRKFTLREC